MKPIFRVLNFKAKFNNECDYNLGNSNQNDWNKLMKLSNLPDADDRSIRLGWRWNLSKSQMELGLYGHINNNWHTVPLEYFVSKDAFFNAELILSYNGLFVTVDNNAVAIKRNIFSPDVLYLSGANKSAYFGGDERASHDMRIYVEDIIVDCSFPLIIPTSWDNASDKGFAFSEFYNSESQNFYASNQIQAPLPCLIEGNSTSINSVIIHSGAKVNFTAGNSIKLLPGFKVESGATFHAEIKKQKKGESSDTLKDKGIFPVSYESYPDELNNSIDTENNSYQNQELETSNNTNCIIYPNPFNRIISISYNSLNKFSIQILNTLGVKIFESENNNIFTEINLSNYSEGIYLIRVISDNKLIISEKIIKSSN